MQDPTISLTPPCTIVYPELFEPKAFKDNPPKFSATFLIDKAEDMSGLRNAIRAAAMKKWPSNPSDFYTKLNLPLRNGESKAIKDGEIDKTNFYYGKIFFNAKSAWQPQIVNVYNEELKDENEIYGGCIVQAYIGFYAYDYMGKLGVGAGLRAVCKIEDGPPLGGGRVDTATAFNSVIKERETFQDNPPDFNSKEYNETGQQGQSGNRIIGPDQDPWEKQEPREPGVDAEDDGIPF